MSTRFLRGLSFEELVKTHSQIVQTCQDVYVASGETIFVSSSNNRVYLMRRTTKSHFGARTLTLVHSTIYIKCGTNSSRIFKLFSCLFIQFLILFLPTNACARGSSNCDGPTESPFHNFKMQTEWCVSSSFDNGWSTAKSISNISELGTSPSS